MYFTTLEITSQQMQITKQTSMHFRLYFVFVVCVCTKTSIKFNYALLEVITIKYAVGFIAFSTINGE